jgi:outer membrane protein assembly factor BamE (lipoprotein component of BamABCDE complex)
MNDDFMNLGESHTTSSFEDNLHDYIEQRQQHSPDDLIRIE